MFKRLGLEFWLPLPAIAGVFWLASTWLTDRAIGRTYEPVSQLTTQSQQPIQLSFSLTVTAIDAEIDRDLGATEVTVQAIGSTLQELEFEYPLVEYREIERAIARELTLSPDVVRQIIRYRINY